MKDLNIDEGYCSHWTLNDAIREVLQNTLDGAVDYVSRTGDLSRDKLLPHNNVVVTINNNNNSAASSERKKKNDKKKNTVTQQQQQEENPDPWKVRKIPLPKAFTKSYPQFFRNFDESDPSKWQAYESVLVISVTDDVDFDPNKKHSLANYWSSWQDEQRGYESSSDESEPEKDSSDDDDEDSYGTPNKKKKKKPTARNSRAMDWCERDKSVARIRILYAVEKSKDFTPVFGKVQDGSILISIQADNKSVGFRMSLIERLGKSMKRGYREQAGRFGEGFKVGSVVMARKGYKVFVEGGKERKQFKIHPKKRTLCSYGKQTTNITKNTPSIVSVTISKDPKGGDCYSYWGARFNRTDTFDHYTFRLLAPGKPSSSKGEIFRDEKAMGLLFCLGIRVSKQQLIFGYDLPNFAFGRDRNVVNIDSLRDTLADVWESHIVVPGDGDGGESTGDGEDGEEEKEDDKEEEEKKKESAELMDILLERLLKVHAPTQSNADAEGEDKGDKKDGDSDANGSSSSSSDEEEDEDEYEGYNNLISRYVEVQCIECSPDLQKAFAAAFKKKEGDEAFPCRKAEAKQVRELLPHRKGLVLNDMLVTLLRRGGYLEVEAEKNTLYSRDNPSKVDLSDPMVDAMINAALFQLNNLRDGLSFVRDDLFFVDGSKLPKGERNYCQRIKGTYFLSDKLLETTDSPEQNSFMIGYNVALNSREPNLHFEHVIQKGSIQWSIIVREIGGYSQVLVEVSDSLLNQNFKLGIEDEVVADNGNGSEDTLRVERSISIKDKYTMLNDLEPDTMYKFRALDADGAVVKDPLTAAYCVTNFRTSPAPPPPVNDEDTAEGRVTECNNITSSDDDQEDEDPFGGYIGGCRDDDVGGDDDDNDYIQAISQKNENEHGGGEEEQEEEEEQEHQQEEELKIFKDEEEEAQFIFESHRLVDSDCGESEDENQDEQPAAKRRRKVLPCDMTEVTLGGKVYHQNGVYYWPTSRAKSYCRIHSFEGKEHATKVVCDIIEPLSETYVGSSGKTTYVERRATMKIDKLSDLREHSGRDIPTPKYEYEREVSPEKRCFFHAYRNINETHQNLETKQRTALEIFPGFGGMANAMANAGFKVVGLVETNKQAAASLVQKYPEAIIYAEYPSQFLNRAEKGDQGYPKHVDYLHLSSPPVEIDEVKNRALCGTLIRAIEAFEPLVATFINVQGVLIGNKEEEVKLLAKSVLELGYKCRIALHCASDFGDPQALYRVVIYAAKEGVPLPEMPEIADSPVSVGNVLKDLETVDPVDGCGLVTLQDNEPPGQTRLIMNHTKITQDAGVSCLYLDASKPAPCFKTKQTAIQHPNLNRILTSRECARLKSFSDEQQFFGSHADIQKQLDFAVPGKMTAAVAKVALEAFGVPADVQVESDKS